MSGLKADVLNMAAVYRLAIFSTHIILKNADLRLQPLKFGLAGGSIVSNIHLEGDKSQCRGGRIYRRVG